MLSTLKLEITLFLKNLAFVVMLGCSLKSSMNLPYATHRFFLNIDIQKHLKIKLLKHLMKFHNSIEATVSI